MAIAAKGRAEGHIRALNNAVQLTRPLLGVEGQVDPHLIGVFDFFGQPSFGIWSFDSADVSEAKGEAEHMRGVMDGLLLQIRPLHDALLAEVNQAIDARWGELKGAPEAPEKKKNPSDLAARRAGRRRPEDDGEYW